MEPVVFEGVVEQGRQLGRQLGFPTANLPVPADTLVGDGVYASWAEVGGVRYRAMSNLGSNPSVGAANGGWRPICSDSPERSTARPCGWSWCG